MGLPAGDWFRAVFYWAMTEDTAECVAWWKPTAALSPTIDVQALANAFATAFAATWVPISTTEVTFLGVNLALRNGGTTITARGYTGSPGTSSGDVLPNGSSALVAQQALISGGSGRGRHFIPGLAESLSDGSYISNSGITAITPLVTFFQATYTHAPNSFIPQVYSRKLNQLNDVNFARVDRVLAYRRKRQPVF